MTYPRTDSQYITEDMASTVQTLLADLPEVLPFLSNAPDGARVSCLVDNAKVTDHHAILPTQEAVRADLSQLAEKQKNIFYLVCQRLAQAVLPDCIYEETDVEVLCAETTFKAKGKIVLEPGYQAIENACSVLYGASCRAAKAMGYRRVITYILESEPGTSLKAAGFHCEGRAGGLEWNGSRKPKDADQYPHEMKTRWSKEMEVATNARKTGEVASI